MPIYRPISRTRLRPDAKPGCRHREAGHFAEGVVPAPALFGTEDAVVGQPLAGDDALQVKQLLPTAPGFDYAVNTMTYEPGAALSWWKFM